MAELIKRWERSKKWTPASPGGGSQGFSVECSASGELGHAKPVQFTQEVLASLLAQVVAVMVPHARLGICDQRTVAVSRLWGAKSMDVPSMRTTSPQDFASDVMKAALRQASGLLPFHAWLGTQDLKDEHVMVRPRTGRREYEVAGIDFASAFGWDASGGAVALPQGPPILILAEHRDTGVIQQVLARIERISETCLRETVDLLPDSVLPQPEKSRIVNGLNTRRSAIRPVLHNVGWLSQ